MTYTSLCRCSNNDVGFCLPRRAHFWNKTLWKSGKTALGTYDEPWEDQSWEEPEEAEVLDDDWTDELPPEDPELEDQFDPRSSGGLCSDGVQECFVGHEKRHTNIHGGQGSVFSSKARKRSLSCGRCGCFRWFSNDNVESITTDWRWERCEHWHEQPGK